jgi:endoglucanase
MDSPGATGAVGNFNYLRFTRTASQDTLSSAAAAFVRDGPYAGTNYGPSATLEVKKSTVGYNRQAYVKFDLSSVTTIGSAKLRLFGKLGDTVASSITVSVRDASSGWTESGLTWNTRPVAVSAALGSFAVTGTNGKWYEVDVTNYLQAQKAAGDDTVTLLLASQTPSSTLCAFSSNGTADGPRLVIEG